MKRTALQHLWVQLTVHTVMFHASVLNRCRIVGLENVPLSGGVILAGNHISAFETVIIPSAVLVGKFSHDVFAAAKEELFRKPPLSWMMRGWGGVPIRRGRDAAVIGVLADLAKTRSILLFPEGTRHKDGVMGAANRGVGKIIHQAKATVIPVGVTGLNHWRAVGVGQKATIVYGKPLDLTDLYALEDVKATHVAITERLMAAIAALKAEADRLQGGPRPPDLRPPESLAANGKGGD